MILESREFLVDEGSKWSVEASLRGKFESLREMLLERPLRWPSFSGCDSFGVDPGRGTRLVCSLERSSGAS